MKKLSLLALLTLLIGSTLFVSGCGSKIEADSVWQATKGAAGISLEEAKLYVCFCADGKLITANKVGDKLVKSTVYAADYTAKNGKIKAWFTGNVECDYKIKGDTMTISKSGETIYELKKVAKPTVAEMKAAN